MTLTGKVVGVESGARFVDQKRHVMIRIWQDRNQEFIYSDIHVANDTFQLDDEVTIDVELATGIIRNVAQGAIA